MGDSLSHLDDLLLRRSRGRTVWALVNMTAQYKCSQRFCPEKGFFKTLEDGTC